MQDLDLTLTVFVAPNHFDCAELSVIQVFAFKHLTKSAPAKFRYRLVWKNIRVSNQCLIGVAAKNNTCIDCSKCNPGQKSSTCPCHASANTCIH